MSMNRRKFLSSLIALPAAMIAVPKSVPAFIPPPPYPTLGYDIAFGDSEFVGYICNYKCGKNGKPEIVSRKRITSQEFYL